jgi:hypothetical protein
MTRLLRVWALEAAFCIAIQAATYTVGFQKTISVAVVGATAAYTVDPEIAEASASQGVVSVTGKNPGTTHLIVVTTGEVQTLEVVVPMPPPEHPKGWVTPEGDGLSNETGSFETRYSSLPEQLTNVLDFSRQGQSMSTRFYLATTDYFLSASNQNETYGVSNFSVTSLSYSIQTARLGVTLVDQLVDESPLTVSGATIRGLHWREGDWFFHVGYTSPAPFDGLFLPIRAEGVFGAGYRFHLSQHSRLIPSFYYLTMPEASHAGKPGAILSLQYTYEPSDDLHFAAEIGDSRSLGASSFLSYKRLKENLRARLRYTPDNFAALSISSLRGFYSDAAWTRQWAEHLVSDLNFTGDRFNLPAFQELSVNGGLQLRYQPWRHWTLFGGVTSSIFRAEEVDAAPLEGISYPEGAGFTSRHFSANFQHQWSRFTAQNTGGHQYLVSARVGFGHFNFSGYAERETQAPTVGFVLSQVNGLAELLNQYGVVATTPQQITDFLNQNAALINLQYLSGVTINLTPLREQLSGTASWQGRGAAPEIEYEYLLNNDLDLTGGTKIMVQRVTATKRLGRSNDLLLTLAEYRTQATGRTAVINPYVAFSLKHRFNTVPAILMLERHGTVRGRIFEDPDGQGVNSADAAGVASVEVILDNVRRDRTGPDGTFRFAGVPEGKHEVHAILHGETPSYFTTPEEVEASQNSEVYFGVARLLSSLGGEVRDDTERGISGIGFIIQGEDRRVRAVSSADGKFFVPRLPDGEYTVSVDAETLPAGYIIQDPAEVHVVTASGKAPRANLRVRALRNLSGRALVYDRELGKYVGIPGVVVVITELSLKATTDADGRFLFRELRSGTFNVSAVWGGRTVNRMAIVPEQPVQMMGADLMMGQR